jgi:membrane protein implicated in regulation of membrane protease activity
MKEEYYAKAFRGFFFKGIAHFLGLILLMYFLMMALTGGSFHFSFISIALFSYVILYVMTHKIRRKTVGINGKQQFIQDLKDAVAYLHYDIIEENDELVIIKPQWHEKAYTAKLFIELKEDEVIFIGVVQHIYKILEAYQEQRERRERR